MSRTISSEDVIVFDGHRFVRNKKTGYYLSSKQIKNNKRYRLHRYVWEYYHGEVPEGYCVHHIDGNKNNNGILNLTIIPKGKHVQHHSLEKHNNEEWHNFWRKRFEPVRQKGTDIYKHNKEKRSLAAKKAWKTIRQTREPAIIKCAVCGKEKKTYYPERTCYCSKKCYQKAFRKNFKEKHGYCYDKYVRPKRIKPKKEPKPKTVIICAVCGKPKETYLPEQTKFCSRACKARHYRAEKMKRAQG